MPYYTNFTSGAVRYVSVPNVAPLQFERTNAFTLMAWVNTIASGGFYLIMGKTAGISAGANIRGYDTYFTSNGKIGFNRNSNFEANEGLNNYAEVQTVSSGFNDGKWKHLAFTCNGTNAASGMRILVNAVPVTVQINHDDLTGTILNSAVFAIGQQSTVQAAQFIGGIFGVSVHNRVLTDQEISNAAKFGAGPGLNTVGAWLLGEAASVPTIPDVSPNSNNGTMNNLALSDILWTPDLGNRPTVTNIVPTPGSLARNQSVQFDVTDDLGLAAVLVYVTYAGRSTEIVHDGTTFRFPYLGSSRTAITGGFRYVVNRTGGWKAAPRFTPHAVDTEGRENV